MQGKTQTLYVFCDNRERIWRHTSKEDAKENLEYWKNRSRDNVKFSKIRKLKFKSV